MEAVPRPARVFLTVERRRAVHPPQDPGNATRVKGLYQLLENGDIRRGGLPPGLRIWLGNAVDQRKQVFITPVLERLERRPRPRRRCACRVYRNRVSQYS